MNYDAIVDKYAGQLAIPGVWIRAVIMTESTKGQWPPTADQERAFRNEPKRGEGSVGLMQILPSTAKDMGFQGSIENLYEPETNIFYGSKYLKDCIRRVGSSDVRRVYSAYNSGRGDLWETSSEVKANVERFLRNLSSITTAAVEKSGLAVAVGGGFVVLIVYLILWHWKGKV